MDVSIIHSTHDGGLGYALAMPCHILPSWRCVLRLVGLSRHHHEPRVPTLVHGPSPTLHIGASWLKVFNREATLHL
ncbi:hypothetical protein CsSME_00048083 [Camellia sinensis var. sinensis]